MYLSRLVLNPRSKYVRNDLNDCQEMHRTILSAFPNSDTNSARADFGILFRVENYRQSVVVLVQSRILPDWSKLPSGYLLDEPKCQDISRHYSSEVLHSGKHLIFRLRANPTRKIDTKSLPDGTKRNGKRVEIYKEQEQIDWLRGKAMNCGFKICHLTVKKDVLNLNTNPESKVSGKRWQDERKLKKNTLTFGSVLFEGEIEITDPKEFSKSLEQGIGTGKAYGFGLLSIAPIR